MTWRVHCDRGDGSGEIVYKGDSFEGTMKMTVQGPRGGGPMEVTQTMSGKRLGDCPKP